MYSYFNLFSLLVGAGTPQTLIYPIRTRRNRKAGSLALQLNIYPATLKVHFFGYLYIVVLFDMGTPRTEPTKEIANMSL